MARTTESDGPTKPAPVQSPKRRGRPLRHPHQPWVTWAAICLVAGGIAAGIAVTRSGTSSVRPKPTTEVALAGLQTGPAPWPPEIDHLADRLRAIGLPALTQEGTVLHIHQHLDVFVDGKQSVVPAGIGIDDNSFISPIHTHDPSGVLHLESPQPGTFTLGQFFAIWGVRFRSSCLGSYCSARAPKVYVNGKRVAGDPTRLALASHQEIAVVIGRPPGRIPSSYPFPAGE
jgi:hypothetical protein